MRGRRLRPELSSGSMRRLLIAAMLPVACFVQAVPAEPTPYQAMAWNGGYDSSSLGNGMIEIDVRANAFTSEVKVRRLQLRVPTGERDLRRRLL